ncbi:flavodoxin [Selenomonas sp. oral taxon 126]|uniref:flavodoxin n=1 Tax=Selenomonas sp. oral taxon 126 TaxID=712528 RepID=UPI00080788B0|nr:flavodoxin [Selenomonas sp. oral taxon 126]ANR69624.1 flavodoxin [Selenomonas sp. oral taxon 126]
MYGKMLIAYFSASPSRRTETVAKKIADVISADLYEIVPAEIYTQDDLNWNNDKSRSSVEMRDPASRPAIAGALPDLAQYSVVFVGFPIWWYVAPHIINTFLESYDLTGKIVVPFATSGGSSMGQTTAHLRPSAKGALVKEGRRFEMGETPMAINSWIAALGI